MLWALLDKTQNIFVAIATLAVLTALCTTASAGGYGDGCPFSNFYNGTLYGGVYFVSHGWYDTSSGVTETAIFENVPDGRQIVRFYPGIWTGSPMGGYPVDFSIEINGNKKSFSYQDNNPSCWSDPICNVTTTPPECNVSITGCGVSIVRYNNAAPDLVTGNNTISFWTSEQIYDFPLLVVHENESMPKIQYWIKEGHEYPDDGTDNYIIHFNETANTGKIQLGSVQSADYYIKGNPRPPHWPYLNGHFIEDYHTVHKPFFSAYTDIPPEFVSASTNTIVSSVGNARAMVAVLVLKYYDPSDLAVTNISPQSPLYANQVSEINATVTNYAGYARFFDVTLYANDTKVDVKQVTNLSQGESKTVTFSWTPDHEGLHMLNVTADVENEVLETNEANNTKIMQVNVEPSYGPVWRNQSSSASTIPVGSSIELRAQGNATFGLDYAILWTNETGTWMDCNDYGSPMQMSSLEFDSITHTSDADWNNQTLENLTVSGGDVMLEKSIDDVARYKPAYASSGGPCQNANDGDPYSYWMTQNPPVYPEWWYVDLGKVFEVQEITWGDMWGPHDYSIDISNDTVEWTTKITRIEGRGETFTNLNWSCQYIRIYFTATHTIYRPAIHTFEAYAPADYKSPGTLTSSTITTDNPIVSVTPTWNLTERANTSLSVYISVDNGATWKTAVTGEEITWDYECTNTKLKYKGLFETTDGNETPVLHDITLNYKTKDAPKNTWLWSNFTWHNDSITDKTVGWKICYTDLLGQITCTDVMTFDVSPELKPATPFLSYGWVNYDNGDQVNDPDVNITNLNTSETYAVETNASFNYYQVITNSDNVSAGDVLHFTAIAETTTEFDYTVTEADMNRGGFEQNITIAKIPRPDLIVTAINAYHYNTGCSPWFNMSNEVDVTVKNTGDVNATEAFNVSVSIDDGYYAKQNVPGGLNVSESVTMTFTDWKPIGEDCFVNCVFSETYHDYAITAVADCDNDIEERYEENNATTISGEDGRACYNGYMADEPLENAAHGILNGRLNFTTGNGTYGGLYSLGASRATEYAITIPAGASLKLAKLNVYYTWHYDTYCPVMEVSITNETGPHVLDMETRYNDMKCQCPGASWRLPWGNYVYNITDSITGSGTYIVTVTRTGGEKVSIAAPGIVYVYEDANEPTIEYWINEGADILIGGRRGDGGYLAWWECINNATFPASTGTSDVAGATVGVVTPWGDDVTDDILSFNDIELGRGVYSGYSNTVDETIDGMSMYIGSTNAQVGVNMTDVTAQYLNGSENKVSQADDGDNMMPSNAFLVVEYTEKEKDDLAIAEATTQGEITAGNFTSTHVSDNVSEAIKEDVQGPKSLLEHKWTIDVTGGSNVTFYVEANRTTNTESDDFVFAYSTDDSIYEDMVTVTNTSDTDTYQTYELPSDLSGTVYIRVMDTDRTKGNKTLDTIYIDHMFIRSVFATPSYGVSVTMEPASQKVAPGNSTTYNVTVTNTGDFNASYCVTMSGTAVNESNNITVNPLNWNTGILELTAEDVQIVTVYTDASTPEETYTLTATATCDNDTNVTDSDTSDLVVSSANYTDDKAIAEQTMIGTRVEGNYTYTFKSDNMSEAIEEVVEGPRSKLEHEWTIDVTSGNKTNVTFHFEANRTDNVEGDDFKFEYSADGSTYHDLVTVNEPVDTVYSCKMSNELNGNVTIRVTDTDRGRGNKTPDTVYIDHMYIRSVFGTPEPGVMHVHNITMWNTSKGPNYKIYTQVTIVDVDNDPVIGATVELNTTSPSSPTESFSDVTGVMGW